MMLGEICAYLKNYFDKENYYAYFVIGDGDITYVNGQKLPIMDSQYYRIDGSVFHDGVYKQGDPLPGPNETFTGFVRTMAVPPDLIALAGEIEAWKAKYEAADSPAMSPFNSESFGGYQYSKTIGGSGSFGAPDWKSMFASRLSRWRKL